MATLKELSDPEKSRAFAAEVARKSMMKQDDGVVLNHGFKNDKELIDRIKQGDAIIFDYNRLLSEAGEYV